MMENQNNQNVIASIIRSECEKKHFGIKKLILFGSRASGNALPDSDWDFIAVVDKALEWKDKMSLWKPIYRKLAELGLTADLLIKNEAEFERDKVDTGKVTYYAHKQGIEL